MGQFIVALLIGGFFSLLPFALQYLFIIDEKVKEDSSETDERGNEIFEVYLPYSANIFRTVKNQDWLFTDAVMLNIINYFRSELTRYKGTFTKEESIELSYILYDKTNLIEQFIHDTKRGKPNDKTFSHVVQATFQDYADEKSFLLRKVFTEVQNTLIDDLITRKVYV